MLKRLIGLLLIAMPIVWWPAMAATQSAEDFYRGKSINVIIPTGPGGTYALYDNLANEILPRHLPGSPRFIMQFIPSGIQAMNYLYNVPSKDGLTIGMLSQTAPILQVLSPDLVKYDVHHFAALGLLAQLNAVLTVSSRTAVQSVDDLKRMPITLGATDTSSYQYLIPQLMNRYLGTKIKVITGYKGIAESTLAMVRGEVDGTFTSWLAIKQQLAKSAFESGDVRVLMQVGYNSEPDLNVPLLQALAPDARTRRAFNAVSAFSALSRCLIAPPHVPDDRIAALRAAVAATIADPAFEAALKQRHLPYRPLSWQEQQAIMNEAADTPRSLIQ